METGKGFVGVGAGEGWVALICISVQGASLFCVNYKSNNESVQKLES